MLLLNAFSINMLDDDCDVSFTKITPRDALAALSNAGFESAVGHAETAAVFAEALGMAVPCQRSTVSLLPGSGAIVGQYTGPRLPEGATALPPGATITWWALWVW